MNPSLGSIFRSAGFVIAPFVVGAATGYIVSPVFTSLVAAPVIGITELDQKHDELRRKKTVAGIRAVGTTEVIWNTIGTKVASVAIFLSTGGIFASSFAVLKTNVIDLKHFPSFVRSENLVSRGNAKKIFFKGLWTSCSLLVCVASGFLILGLAGRFMFHSSDTLTKSEKLVLAEERIVFLETQLKNNELLDKQ